MEMDRRRFLKTIGAVGIGIAGGDFFDSLTNAKHEIQPDPKIDQVQLRQRNLTRAIAYEEAKTNGNEAKMAEFSPNGPDYAEMTAQLNRLDTIQRQQVIWSANDMRDNKGYNLLPDPKIKGKIGLALIGLGVWGYFGQQIGAPVRGYSNWQARRANRRTE